jgi:hypothetical protein
MHRFRIFLFSLVVVLLLVVPVLAVAAPTNSNTTSDTVEVFILDPILGTTSVQDSVYLSGQGIYVRYCDDSVFRTPSLKVTDLNTFEHRVEAYLTYPTLLDNCYKARVVNVTGYLGSYPSGAHTFWINRESYEVSVP